MLISRFCDDQLGLPVDPPTFIICVGTALSDAQPESICQTLVFSKDWLQKSEFIQRLFYCYSITEELHCVTADVLHWSLCCLLSLDRVLFSRGIAVLETSALLAKDR